MSESDLLQTVFRLRELTGKVKSWAHTTDHVQAAQEVLDILDPATEIKILDLAEADCPTCGLDGLLDSNGIGRSEDLVWCEVCGWEGVAHELMG